MESITIKKDKNGRWYKKFDDYENSFSRISKNEALESIKIARESNRLYCDANENSQSIQIFGYWN